MSTPKKIILSILLLGSVALLLLEESSVITIIAALIPNVIAAYLLYIRTDNAYSMRFSEKDWEHSEDNDYVLRVPHKKHKKSAPTAKVYILNDDGSYQIVITDVIVDTNNDLLVNVSCFPFKGKVVIN